ncbi:hypothetical protein QN416_26900, partial [Glaciimonas sp. Cout2]|uniref:hypothetical protein n=1 Tax=Glaciimonas sp. Cout2 TaxID=3048621 RepID=UPI002B224758
FTGGAGARPGGSSDGGSGADATDDCSCRKIIVQNAELCSAGCSIIPTGTDARIDASTWVNSE